jgi:hypothetical protein
VRPERRPNGAVAGYLLLAVVLLFASVGAGLGALVDAVAPFLVAAVFLGFIAGLVLVITRYRTL